MLTRALTAVLIAGLLTGCGANIYNKPGGTQADLDRDSYQCDLETWRPASPPLYATPAPGHTMTGASQSLYNMSGAFADRAGREQRVRTCLQLRGWRKD